MSLNEIIQKFYANYPYIPLIAVGASAVVSYIVGRIHGSSISQNDPYNVLKLEQTSNLNEPSEDDDNYKSRQISEAVNSCKDSRIEGVIKEFYITQDGYSGVIIDSGGEVPFFMNQEDINTYEDEGLLPILLNDSLKTKTTVKMDGQFDDEAQVFTVDGLEHRMNDINYEI